MKNKHKQFLVANLLLLILFAAVFYTDNKVDAAVKPANRTMESTPLNSGLKVRSGGYRYYPEIADDIAQTPLRQLCGANYEKLPWIAQYASDPADDFQSLDRRGANSLNTNPLYCSSARYRNGGPGVWMPPSALAGWALKGVKDTTVTGTKWTSTVNLSPGTGLPATSNQFEAGQKVVGWRTDLDNTDSEIALWGNNEQTGLTDLLSNGHGLFRNEFSFSSEEWAYIQANPSKFKIRIKSRADDFHKVYLNGVALNNYDIRGVGLAPNHAVYAPYNSASPFTMPTDLQVDTYGSGAISTTTLLSTYGLTQSDNVVAFQVMDKARWTTKDGAAGGLSSNAIGLWFKIDLVYSDVTGCTNPNASNYDPNATSDNGSCTLPQPTCSCNVIPNQGTAPIVATATVNVLNGTGSYNVSVNFDSSNPKVDTTLSSISSGTILSPSTLIKARHTYLKGGLYQVTYSVTGNGLNITNQPCGSGNTVDVKNPSSNTGGEVAP